MHQKIKRYTIDPWLFGSRLREFLKSKICSVLEGKKVLIVTLFPLPSVTYCYDIENLSFYKVSHSIFDFNEDSVAVNKIDIFECKKHDIIFWDDGFVQTYSVCLFYDWDVVDIDVIGVVEKIATYMELYNTGVESDFNSGKLIFMEHDAGALVFVN